MAEVARQSPMPLATNMCVVAFDQLAPGGRQTVGERGAFGPSLLGWPAALPAALRASATPSGLALSMHSNSHLGISLAAMVHLAGATPNLTYACDTHWPWKTEEVIKPGVLEIRDGSVAVPTTPGLGVELDDDALGGTARAVRPVRNSRPRRHRLHAEHRSGLRGRQPPLVARLMHHRRNGGADHSDSASGVHRCSPSPGCRASSPSPRNCTSGGPPNGST